MAITKISSFREWFIKLLNGIMVWAQTILGEEHWYSYQFRELNSYSNRVKV
jgi:hypothetical protein